ncbi:MAG: flavin reductase family protein [Alphaproteobacteria bacterium]
MHDQTKPGFDPAAFRTALGCFGTGVTIATCRDAGGKPVGITINSFTSVSLDPPLILFCLGRTTRAYKAFMKADKFSINILTTDQEALARHFSSPEAENWTQVQTLQTPDTGPPLLKNCLSQIVCHRHAVHPGGDHDILIGAVTELCLPEDPPPLLYFRGQYRRFS